MQNEFEKQVQQKMEELKLVPSDPVWRKVEWQIRKEKDRRRVVFWIPLFALIGAGLWLGIDNYSNTTAYKTPKTVKQNSVSSSPSVTTAPLESFKTVLTTRSSSQHAIQKSKIESPRFSPSNVKRNSSKGIENSLYVSRKENTSGREKNTGIATKSKSAVGNTEPLTPKESGSGKPSNTTLKVDSNTVEKPVITSTSVSEPARQDSSSVKPPIKKYATSRKWKYNLVVASGLSGIGRVEIYNGQKSMNVYSIPAGMSGGGSGQYSSYGPSAVEKGFAFAVGGTVKKELTKRTSFATGLHYNYYSNTIQVGSQVNQNILIQNYPVSRFYYSAMQYYSGQTTVLQPFKNQYHFLSIPADIDWQILRKRPLNLYFGLALQYLLASNALRYDYNSQSYYHNINAFNRTQLMSAVAITYSVSLKQKPLSFGPQVQYGLTRLEKGNADNHLFSYGLKAEWQFKK